MIVSSKIKLLTWHLLWYATRSPQLDFFYFPHFAFSPWLLCTSPPPVAEQAQDLLAIHMHSPISWVRMQPTQSLEGKLTRNSVWNDGAAKMLGFFMSWDLHLVPLICIHERHYTQFQEQYSHQINLSNPVMASYGRIWGFQCLILISNELQQRLEAIGANPFVKYAPQAWGSICFSVSPPTVFSGPLWSLPPLAPRVS